MDPVYRGQLQDSPQSSAAESDVAQAPSRNKRNQHNGHRREIVTNVSDPRVDHFSSAAYESEESPPRQEDDGPTRHTTTRRRSESTSLANPKPIQYSRSETYAPMSTNAYSTAANPQRRHTETSTSQYGQADPERVQKLTNSDPRSFISTTVTHNGFHGVDIGANAPQVAQAMQRSFNHMTMMEKTQSDQFLQGMRERAEALEHLEQGLQWYINAYRQVKHEKEGIIQEKERIAHERNVLQRQVKELQDQVAGLQQQLQVQDQKLVVSVNSYSTHTADGASGADVITAVQQLNEEIFQFVAILADEHERLSEERRKVKWDEKIDTSMRYMFIDAIVGFVHQAMERGEHAWIGYALQTCILESCTSYLTSLTPFGRSSVEETYHAIRRAEDQGVSGQWRSLAYRHSPKRLTERSKVLRDRIQTVCQNLGWPRWRSESQHGEGLQSIISKTVSLHKMIFTETLSGDFKVIFPPPNSPFDPETMKIDDNDRKENKKPTTGEPIVCTTDMGVMKLVMQKRHSDGEWKFDEHKTVILKATVTLRDSLPGDPNERAEVSSRSHVAREFRNPY